MVAEGEMAQQQQQQQLPKDRSGGGDKGGGVGLARPTLARLDGGKGDAAVEKALLAAVALRAQAKSASGAPAGWSTAAVAAPAVKESGKRAKPEAPKFLLLLYEILEVEDSRVIRWSEDGSALQILSPETVTEKILPKYFNHTNFHSFQRQLNYFGFRKWTKSKTDICTFSHPCFRQNQPEMLQLIKRKKAPRRTPSPDQSSNGSAGGQERTAAKRTPQTSPTATGKRKLPSDERLSSSSSGMVIQRPSSASNVLIHPAANGIPISSMTTPHATARQPFGFGQDNISQYLPGAQPLLNNVISPLAASECKKKAKKMDRKDFPERENGASPEMPVPVSVKSEAKPTVTDGVSMSKLSPLSGLSSGSLPTLDIVRNRIIRRQQSSAPDLGALANGHQEYASSMVSSGMLSPLAPIRPDFSTGSFPSSSSLGTSDQHAAPSPSFNDPVNILLHIKKSRGSEASGSAETATKCNQPADTNDSMTSLQNFLLGHSLYTNRLEAQLKFVLEENDALKQLLEVRHREIQSLKNDRSMLQHENGSLSKDKTKLLEINRDLMSKLFPQ